MIYIYANFLPGVSDKKYFVSFAGVRTWTWSV